MDNYEIFYRTFLAEMPWVVDGSNAFEAHHQMLKELLSYNAKPKLLGNNVYKLSSNNQSTYWVGDANADSVSIITDTETNGNFCKVVLTSKNPAIAAKSPPYASDLYLRIKQDVSNLNLVFSSDNMLSADAVKLWTRISNQGEHVSVYDTHSMQYELNPVNSVDELSKYLGDHNSSRYVFVLSENTQEFKGVLHSFSLMELKRNAGYPLQELFEHLKRSN